MKQPPHSQEPKKWASGLYEDDAPTGRDAEIDAREGRLLEALGRPAQDGGQEGDSAGDSAGVSAPGTPRAEFRDRLRGQFLEAGSREAEPLDAQPSAAVSEPHDEPDDEALSRLKSWSPGAPREAFRAEVREAFLAAAPAAVPSAEPEQVRQGVQQQHQAGGARSSVERRSSRQGAPSERREGKQPAGLRLVAIGGLLAAAAAALFFVLGPGAGNGSSQDPSVEQPGPNVAEAGENPQPVDPAPEAPASTSGWEIDTTSGDEAALLASVLIDGEAASSPEDFQARMATAERIETVGSDLRVRHRDEFMIELVEGSVLKLDRWEEQPAGDASRVLFAERGGIRVATGPGFDSVASLVVETPHVRTRVTGTIFGVDIGKGYTCVCCLEGSVESQPLGGTLEPLSVPAGRTWIANNANPSPWQVPIVPEHLAPLAKLADYWS